MQSNSESTKERDLRYAETLAKLIRCETVSVSGDVNAEKFRPFHELLKETFPRLFAVSDVEGINGSLLLRWPGQSKETPILLMSHHDVVAAPGSWTHAPFSGDIADGKLWGRGTLDTKNSLWAMLQAAEELIEDGFTPARDVWFFSANTEETDGSGADTATKLLSERGIRFAFVIDEGGYILHDPIGGADADFAVVGVGEKGCADLKFIARSNGGHASMPGRNTPLVRLGQFMAEADRAGLFTVKMNDVTAELFRRCGKQTKGPLGFLLRNVNIFKPLLTAVMPSVSNAAGAMLKTTLAFTEACGSQGTNVLPQEAWVIGNMRFSHHQGQKDSIGKITALAKKYGIETEILDPGFESAVSDYRSDAFALLEEAVSAVFPGVTAVPYIMTGASDCRYFSHVSDNCFRFAPFSISDAQLDSVHGIDENIDIDGLSRGVDFFRYIITGA